MSDDITRQVRDINKAQESVTELVTALRRLLATTIDAIEELEGLDAESDVLPNLREARVNALKALSRATGEEYS